MKYEEQIEAVRPIARKLLNYDAGAMLMGGAPRDWYLKQEARDIDFFLVPAGKRSLDWNYNLIEKELGVKLTPVVGEGYEQEGLEDPWEDEDKIKAIEEEEEGDWIALPKLPIKPKRVHPILAVREAVIGGLNCQFVMVKDVWGTYDEFPCSLSKFAISCRYITSGMKNLLGGMEIGEAGILSKGVCCYKPDTKPAYTDKIKERYGFQFKPYQEVEGDLYGNFAKLQERVILQSIKLGWNE